MKRFFVASIYSIALVATGCDRSDNPSSNTPPQATTPSTPVPAATPAAPVDPAVASAGLRLNEARDLINAQKWDAADAKLKEVEPVKDKISNDQKAELSSLRIVWSAGKKTMGTPKP